VVGSEIVPESVGDDVGGFFAPQFPHQDAAADLSTLLSLVKFPDVLIGAGWVGSVGVSDHLSDEGQVGVAGEGHRSVAVDRIVARRGITPPSRWRLPAPIPPSSGRRSRCSRRHSGGPSRRGSWWRCWGCG
jgi:hypothetical protein